MQVFKSRTAGICFYMPDGKPLLFVQDPRNMSHGRYETSDPEEVSELTRIAGKNPLIYQMEDDDETQQEKLGQVAKAVGVNITTDVAGTTNNEAADKLAASIKAQQQASGRGQSASVAAAIANLQNRGVVAPAKPGTPGKTGS